MSADIGRKAEVEITPAMLDAGAAALVAYDRRFDLMEEGAARVFRAMWAARSTDQDTAQES